MEIYQFQLCGIGIEIQSDRPIEPNEDILRFRKFLTEPDLTIRCRSRERIAPRGSLLGGTEEKTAYRDGSRILRCAYAGGKVYAMLTYSPEHPESAVLEIPEKEWNWVTRGLRLWIAACFPQLLTNFGGLLIHASMIGYREQGILFTAPSQTGKSTQARLWHKLRGAEIINGDKAGILPGPAPQVCSVPFSGTSGICQNQSLPLKAVVVLSQAPRNSVRRLAGGEAVAAVFDNIFADRAVPEEWQHALTLVMNLVQRVPVYALACTPDEAAVQTLEKILFP